MRVHLSPQATRTGRILQESGTPSSGWITGQLMGRIWLVETLLPMDLSPHNVAQEFKSALKHVNADLLGVFFAHMPVSQDDHFRGDLVLRIRPEGIESAIISAEDETFTKMVFFPVSLSGGVHAEHKINEKG